ncbi:hypothetical protein [Dickeya dianthicola]|uniref:Uncharacterized protein n=1 Tax=Dickeya dianthicola TaxID=204039 RepID=A0AAX1CB85_9GAMM|nr:hypothetical protein [Dickeya dianthicola]MBT1426658.1 hypothetical protein [Dickeya dianthicola]MBT1430712.1 hypothetical protein [Dickeya dianthicola]MBT1458181.1 hypothetical protein [Dickeya dianthicola]MBT1489436.1 hypothetical protein [Dickeya dianthicola]MCA7002592.1 hypothetical protein [Dickeya dianthicola]
MKKELLMFIRRIRGIMDEKLDAVKNSGIEVVGEVYKHYKDILTAYTEKKWWRLIALVILMLLMIVVGLLVKPLLVGLLTKWLALVVSSSVSNVMATCAGTFVTAQVGKFMKCLVLKIKK